VARKKGKIYLISRKKWSRLRVYTARGRWHFSTVPTFTPVKTSGAAVRNTKHHTVASLRKRHASKTFFQIIIFDWSASRAAQTICWPHIQVHLNPGPFIGCLQIIKSKHST
jgi:hypothetical protein